MNATKIFFMTAVLGIAAGFAMVEGCRTPKKTVSKLEVIRRITLPGPMLKGTVSIEEALAGRRSRRDYSDRALRLNEISQLLWAAQGITGEGGKRTTPSAGATYPLEIYLISFNVDSLARGVYHYEPEGHVLAQIAEDANQTQLSFAALMQGSVSRAAAIFVIAADYERTTKKYSVRGERFVHMEAGHAAENICLQAVSLKVGVVTVGAFKDSLIKRYVGIPANEQPLYLIPAGKL